jgi:hypothetical protein
VKDAGVLRRGKFAETDRQIDGICGCPLGILDRLDLAALGQQAMHHTEKIGAAGPVDPARSDNDRIGIRLRHKLLALEL